MTRLELRPSPLPARGDLSEFPFAVLLANARALGVTGVICLREEKQVFLSRGEPVSVRSNFPEESSEVYMLRQGIVGEADLGPARQLAVSRKQRFSEALLGMGMLAANELFEHTRRHNQQNLMSCFRWEQGPFEFTSLNALAPDVVALPLDVVDVFITGVARFYDRRRLDRELPINQGFRVYAKPLPSTPTAGAAPLGTIDARLCQLASGRPTVQSLAVAVSLPDKTVRQRLYVLYCLGRVGFLTPDPEMATMPRPPSRTATAPAFAAPRAFASPRTTPTPTPRPSAGGHVPTGAIVGRRIPTRPIVSGPTPARPVRTMDQLLEEAELARVGGHHLLAISTLRTGLEQWPREPRILADLALSLMYSEPRVHAREANQLSREARQLDATLPIPYVVMGLLMEQIGQKVRARQLYAYALQRDPTCEDAMRLLEKLPA